MSCCTWLIQIGVKRRLSGRQNVYWNFNEFYFDIFEKVKEFNIMSYILRTDRSGTPDVLDKAGATASFLCAIHCAIMPIVVTLLPLVGLGFLAHDAVEWLLIGLSTLLGIVSLMMGFRAHRSYRALLVLGAGIGLLFLGRWTHPPVCTANHNHGTHVSHTHEESHGRGLSVTLLVLGGMTIAGAHLINRSLCRSCRACQALSVQQELSS